MTLVKVADKGDVIIYMTNGTVLKFEGALDIQESEGQDGIIVFSIGIQRHVFKKSAIAGWSLPMTV